MIRMALAGVRHRWVTMASTFLALALGAAIITGCGALLESTLRYDTSVPTSRFAAADLVVRGEDVVTLDTVGNIWHLPLADRSPMPADVTARVLRTPGVAGAVADLSFYAQPVDHRGRPLAGHRRDPQGHPWTSAALTPFDIVAGRPPAAPGEVVLDADLARRGGFRPGDEVRVLTPQRSERFLLAGIAAPPGRDALAEESTVFFVPQTASRLSGRGESVDAIAVFAASGQDRRALASTIRRAEPGLVVEEAGRVRLPATPDEAAPVSALTALAGTTACITTFVILFVLSSMIGLSMVQRRREIALLRAIGASPRQVRALIVREGFVLWLLGTAVGCALGMVSAGIATRLMAGAGLPSHRFQLIAGPLPVLIAAVGTLVIVELASVLTAWKVARIRPVEALGESSADGGALGAPRLLAGLAIVLACVAGLVAAVVGRRALGGGGGAIAEMVALPLAAGAGLLAPLLVRPVVRLVGPILRRADAVGGFLAAANTAAAARRAAAAATPLMVTMVLASTTVFGNAALDRIKAHEGARHMDADFVLMAHDASGLPGSLAVDAAGLSGVAGAAGVRHTTVSYVSPDLQRSTGASQPSGTLRLAEVIDATTAARILRLDVRQGSWRDFHGQAIAVDATANAGLGWHAGQRVGVWLADGTSATLRVAAVYEGTLSPGTNGSGLLLPPEVAVGHDVRALDSIIYVRMAEGADAESVAAELSALTRLDYPTANVVTGEAYRVGARKTAPESWLVIGLLLGLALLYSTISMVSTFVMATAERAREFALLRVLGVRRSQVVRMVAWESIVVLCTGVSMAALIAGLALSALGLIAVGGLVFAVNPWIAAGMVAGSAVIGLGASIVPAQLALRVRPLDAAG